VKAREAKSEEGLTVIYRDVLEDAQAMEDMLRFTQGVRKVPVLVEDGQVTIGFPGT
jgi:glutaredoxin